MTKKKALIYFVILIISILVTSVCKKYFLMDPAKDFPEVCKIAIGPNCTQYMISLVNDKKYDEVVKIQRVRVHDNRALLASFKKKITNKDLLKMSTQKRIETLLSCTDTEVCKKDYYLLETAIVTVKDIVNDLISMADIQENQYKDGRAAIKTLNDAIKILEQNSYVAGSEDTIKALYEKIDSINKN